MIEKILNLVRADIFVTHYSFNVCPFHSKQAECSLKDFYLIALLTQLQVGIGKELAT